MSIPDGMDSSAATLSLAFVATTGCITVTLATTLAFVLFRSKKDNKGKISSEERAVIDDIVEKHVGGSLDKEKYPGGHLTVYYGSQTGTAESFAQQLEREGEDHGFKVHAIDLEDTEDAILDTLRNEERRDDDGRSRAIFLMATYGEGEPTDNSASFINFLKAKAGITSNIIDDEAEKKNLHGVGGRDYNEEKKGEIGDEEGCDPSFFGGLDFAVFGLGNRQYEHFNAMGKLVNEALARTGGRRIIDLGIGDDDDDLEGDFESWKENTLWPTLKKLYHVEESSAVHATTTSAAEKLPDCPYVVEYLPKDDSASKPVPIPPEEMHSSSRHYFTAVDCPVTASRELRKPADSGSTVHLEIDISKAGGDGLSYQTADNLAVLPVNSNEVVEAVAKALSLDLDASFRLKPAPGHEWHGAPFPTPCTVRECLARYCDLSSAPRRSDLKLLASYAKDPMDRKALIRMSSKEGKAEYREKIMDGHVGIVDIVSRLCTSIEAPLEHFVAVCPRLHPRYYTVSSSSSVHPKSIHITVSLTQTTRKDGSVFKGVCSNYLAGIETNGLIRVFCRDSTFRLPSDPARPIIMIGPGTGIAPMRALLQERSYQRTKLNLPVGQSILYFGCKKRTHDYLYEEELDRFCKEGTLTKLHLAFSREQEKKVYVQHLLAKNGKDTWDLIDRDGAYIYVCGGVKMGNDVTEALKTIVADFGSKGPDDAKAYLNQMASEGRFVQELWA